MADDTDTIMKMLEILRAEAGTAGVAGDPFDNLKTEYETAKRSAKSAEDWERYQTAFAKALPEFTSGIISADAAFKSGDVFGGAAAIMDICATTANFIGGLSAAGGPPGAVVGAIFSMVAMILNAFKPQAPSLTEEIENLLRTIEAEGRIDELKTIQDDWRVFKDAVSDAPLKDIPAILRLMNPVEGTCFHLIRYATHWLQNPKNYSQDLWAEILVSQCQFYIEVILSCTLINQRIMSLCTSGGAPGVPYRRDPAYAEAVEAVDVFMLVVNQSHPIQMQFLNDIRPLARNKGLVFHIGSAGGTVIGYRPGPLYLQTVPKGAKKAGDIHDLGGTMDAITVSAVRPARGEKDNPLKPRDNPRKPRLAAFHTSTRDPWPWVEMGIDLQDQGAHNQWQNLSGKPMTDWNGDIMEFEGRRNHPFDKQGRRRYGMSGNWELSKHSDWKPVVERTEGNLAYDIWATPGDLEGQIYLYSASGNRIDHTGATVTSSGFDYNYGFDWNDMPNGYKVGRVRSPSRLSPAFHDEDPAALKDVLKVIYGLCEVSANNSQIVAANDWKNTDHMEIRAYYYNKSRQLVTTNGKSFLAPWPNIRGIGVDSRYLWVFRVAEIACATHTSVKACLDNNLAEPSWNTYKIPDRTIIDPKDGNVYDGLLDLAPCDDGTLTAAVGLWYGPVYTMAPRIDRKAKSIEIDKWYPFDDVLKSPNGPSKAFRVHKQPVGGWSIVEGLMEALEKTSTTLKIEKESVLGGTNAQGTIKLPLPAAKAITVTFATSNKEAIPAPDPVTIKTGAKSCTVSIITQPSAKDEVATISAVLSTSFTTFQPLELTATLKTVPVTFTVDRSVTGGQNANGVIALSSPAAEDIAVTFEITGGKKIFDKPDPITIKKGTKSQTLSIKTSKVAANADALITATGVTGVTGVDPSQPFEDAKLAAPPPLFVLDAKLTAIPPTMKLKAESS